MTTTEQLLAFAAFALPTACVLALARDRAPGALAAFFALLSFAMTLAWALHKAPYEGPTIVTITSAHGLTVVDLVVPPSLAVEAAVLWRARAAIRSLASRR